MAVVSDFGKYGLTDMAGKALLGIDEDGLGGRSDRRQVEVMSGITIENSHNFFRSLNFEQASCRLVRSMDE